MGENLSRRDENGPKLRPKIICYITRKVKNGLICGQNKNGRFWWKQLETAPTYVIIFKRVETYCGGMKMGAWVKMMKIMCNSSRKAKKWDSGCSKQKQTILVKTVRYGTHMVETGCGGMEMAQNRML